MSQFAFRRLPVPVIACFYRASYAKRGLGSRNSVRLSVRLSHACFVTNPKNLPAIFFIPHEKAVILVFWCQRSQRNSNGVTPNGGPKERWGRLKRRFSTNIPGMADRLRRCQLSLLVSVINFWRSAAMWITSTVEICIEHLGREEMVFAARRSYASAVLGVVILSVCPSVTCVLSD